MRYQILPLLFILAAHPGVLPGQCNNNAQFPAGGVPASPFLDTVIVTTEQHAGQYFVVEHLVLGATYIFSSSNSGDYLTIRDVNDPAILLAHGSPPVSLPIPAAGPDRVAVHVNLLSPPCGSDTLDRTTLVVCTSCPPLPPAIGVGVGDPEATLDVAGEVRLGDGPAPALAGMIRWNADNADFEGYDGTKWKSLTRSNAAWGTIPSTNANESLSATASDGATGDEFGSSVCIAGDYAIVGVYQDDIGANLNQGSAYILKRNGTSWTEQAKLTASDGEANDFFGFSVSISGDYAIVGARNDDISANLNQGSAYIFKRNGTSWTEQAKLTASDGEADDLFGCAVWIDGDYVIVGARHDDIGANQNQGSAYIFKRNGTSWPEQSKLTSSDGEANDLLGFSVSISGDYAIIGAYSDDIGANVEQGSAYIFKRNGTSWTEQTKLTASDGAANDLFGFSVSISGDYALIGARYDDIGVNSDQGSAYIFKRNGTSWTEQVKLTASDGTANDFLGSTVSIDGDYVIVGAHDDDIGANEVQGSAYIFKRNGTSWTQQAKLVATNGEAFDRFAFSASLQGDYVIVGSPGYDLSMNGGEGSVYFFFKNH